MPRAFYLVPTLCVGTQSAALCAATRLGRGASHLYAPTGTVGARSKLQAGFSLRSFVSAVDIGSMLSDDGREPDAQVREIGDQRQDGEKQRQEGKDGYIDLRQGFLEPGAGEEYVQGKRRNHVA